MLSSRMRATFSRCLSKMACKFEATQWEQFEIQKEPIMDIGVAENQEGQAMANAMRGEAGNMTVTYAVTGAPAADFLSGLTAVAKVYSDRLTTEDYIALLKCQISMLENHIARVNSIRARDELAKIEEQNRSVREMQKLSEAIKGLRGTPPPSHSGSALPSDLRDQAYTISKVAGPIE